MRQRQAAKGMRYQAPHDWILLRPQGSSLSHAYRRVVLVRVDSDNREVVIVGAAGRLHKSIGVQPDRALPNREANVGIAARETDVATDDLDVVRINFNDDVAVTYPA